MSATIPQLAMINDLYNQLGTPYSQRKKPTNKAQASTLISDLLEAIEDKQNEAQGEELCGW